MFETTALILLASGRSRRFGEGDKLMAPLNDRPLLQHVIEQVDSIDFCTRLAVVGVDQDERQALLAAAGFELVFNDNPDAGQGHSLACGILAATGLADIDRAMIVLGDMPAVTPALFEALASAMAPGVPAVMSEAEGIKSPPALFRRVCFADLATLQGDKGARGVFNMLPGATTVPVDAAALVDVDTPADLRRLEAAHDG